MEGDFPEEIKCPICFEIPQNEIYQCNNGHVVCHGCSKSLLECPQCRVAFEPNKIRNRALETLLDTMKFNCYHKSLGCAVKLARNEFSEHLKICTYSAKAFIPSAPPPTPTPPSTLQAPIPSAPLQSLPVTPAGSLQNIFPQEPVNRSFAMCVPAINRSQSAHNVQPAVHVDDLYDLLRTSCSTSNCSVLMKGLSEEFITGSNKNKSQESLISSRGQTLYIRTPDHNAVVTGNGGHVVQSGTGSVKIKGNPQKITQSGKAEMKVHGNVEEGIVCSGQGTIKIFGNVAGGIVLSGPGIVNIFGDVAGGIVLSGPGNLKMYGVVYGDITVKGDGTVRIHGNHYQGNVHKSHRGTVTIIN